ncbi:sialidase family protein [Aquirhabdus sp.]|uniref:sialidase family protein n=1 Tax=Aquirhabdus sp. TaxID=2824160 RepID=UPI00396C8EEC
MKFISYFILLLMTICHQVYAGGLPLPSVIINPGAQYSNPARSWQGIPGIEHSPKGRLWATWYSGGKVEGAGNYALLSTSADQGLSWSKAKIVIQGAAGIRVFDPLPWLDPKGRLWIFFQQQTATPPGVPTTYGCYAIRTDNPDSENPTWSPAFLVAEGGILFGKPIIQDRDDWLAPFFVIGKPSWMSETKGKETGSLLSRDEGQSWSWQGGTTIPQPIREFSEATIAPRKDFGLWDNSLWMVIRTKRGLYNSTSSDQGLTWSNATPIPGFAGPSTRASMRRLTSGAYLLIYNDSLKAHRRERLTAWLSEDEGRTWKYKLLLDERQNVSYPDVTQLSDGRIYVAYDYGRYITGQKQILVSTFREQDIRAGKFISKDAHAKIIVNQATEYGNIFELALAAAAKAKS